MIRRFIARRRKKRSQLPAPHPTELWKAPTLQDWKPIYPELRNDVQTHLHPELIRALQIGTLSSVIDEIAPDLYRIPVFGDAFLSKFNEEMNSVIEWADQTGATIAAPNSMNNYGVILSDIGYNTIMEETMLLAIRPLASALFPEVGGESLSEQHSFIVEYGVNRDQRLGFHVDDSDVTVNLCLGDQFTGSELFFQGRRCPVHRQNQHTQIEDLVIDHNVGTAILHAGAHRHGALPIEKGRRRNLIMWCRSTEYRTTSTNSCAPWCGDYIPS